MNSYDSKKLLWTYFQNNCSDVVNGGKSDQFGEDSDCISEPETGCMYGICVCLLEGHLVYQTTPSCNNNNHPEGYKNVTNLELGCPRTCNVLDHSNSCPSPSRKNQQDGKCRCADGSLAIPQFFEDHRLILPNSEFQKPDGYTDVCNGQRWPVSPKDPPTVDPTIILGLSLTAVLFVLVVCCLYWKFIYPNRHNMYRLPFIKHFHQADNGYFPSSNNQASDRERNDLQIEMLPGHENTANPSNIEDNPSYISTELLIKSIPEGQKLFKEHFIKCEHIEKGKRIGNGQFGEVFKGICHGSNGAQEVAIKVPKTTWSASCSRTEVENLKAFYVEAQITLGFDHENILSCLGISTGPSGEPWLVVEFMCFGDLAEILRTNSGVLSLQRSDSPVLEMKDLLRISHQVAKGMNYLKDQHFTHRDLAARNCLVGENLLVKISDFGLTRDVYLNEYYRVTGTERLLPVRWMAPECITHGKFTTESDVWAYGVLLWEIFTFGKVPYYVLTNKEVMEEVSHGQHPTPPEGCPDVIKSLMLSCWQHIPTNRISFSSITEKLSIDNLTFSIGYSNHLYGSDVAPSSKNPMSPTLTGKTEQDEKLKGQIRVDPSENNGNSWPKLTNFSPVKTPSMGSPILNEASNEINSNPSVESLTQYTTILPGT